jgi:hypothetical protein
MQLLVGINVCDIVSSGSCYGESKRHSGWLCFDASKHGHSMVEHVSYSAVGLWAPGCAHVLCF